MDQLNTALKNVKKEGNNIKNKYDYTEIKDERKKKMNVRTYLK